MGQTRDPFKKIRDTKGIFHAKLGTIKDRNGMDLTDRVHEELWTKVHNTIKEAVIKTIFEKKKWKKAKWLSDEALQTAEKRSERQRRKGKIPFE